METEYRLLILGIHSLWHKVQNGFTFNSNNNTNVILFYLFFREVLPQSRLWNLNARWCWWKCRERSNSASRDTSWFLYVCSVEPHCEPFVDLRFWRIVKWITWNYRLSNWRGRIPRKAQYKDVFWRTIEILQRASIFEVNCCLKVYNAHLKLTSPILG